jgi:hypothetical protein
MSAVQQQDLDATGCVVADDVRHRRRAEHLT